MGFLERFTTMLRAEACGIVDELADRRRLLQQQLQDAAEALQAERERLARTSAALDSCRADRDRAGMRIAALDADIDLCLARGQEELARFSIGKLLPQRAAAEALDARIAELEQRLAADSATLSAHEEEQAELVRQVQERLARNEATPMETSGYGPAAEQVDLELLRRRREVQHGHD